MARHSLLDENETTTEINLSPMIDCIFILLIFFIVTTVFVNEAGIQVNKPDASASPPNEESLNVVLEITEGNKILIDNHEIQVRDVASYVRQGLVDSETPVVIRAHEKSRHGLLIAVWDQAKLAGAQQLSFNTIN